MKVTTVRTFGLMDPQCPQIASEIWAVCGVGLAEAAQQVFSIQGNSQTAWPGGNGACPKKLGHSSGHSEDAASPRALRKKAANLLLFFFFLESIFFSHIYLFIYF